METHTHLQGIFTSLLTYVFCIFPSESPVREPPPCSLTGSAWTGILQHQSPRSIHSFIHSFMYVCWSHQEGALLHMWQNIQSPSTEPHADRRPTYIGVQPGSPRGSLTTLLSLPQCHAALSMIPSTLAWVYQSPVSQNVSKQPPSGCTLHNHYRLPYDPG